ncbi:MAG: hypothetical protein IOC90_09205 [Methylocystis sp.]|jgi:hypothetical protein|nr:hypothetical protein [Methylocystis sp.]MCA3582300.1 hypothetical protein [Methylocystis sp.]MCA3588195.1 hypothetical protein [Methylocystis sp.]MCA3590113.1 hypothetical protein [Methylocystis sp.]
MVLADDVIERFKRKKANLSCRVCGGPDFALFLENDDKLKTYFEVFNADRPQEAGSAKFRTISTACTNCGHVEEFLLDFVLDRELGETT